MKVEVCPVCCCYLSYEDNEWYCDYCDYVKQDAIKTKSIYKGLE